MSSQIANLQSSKGSPMKIEPYQTNWFFSAMIPMLSSRPGSWFFSHTLHIFDRLVLTLSRGRRTLTELLGGAPVITLTAIGAKSGIPRSVPLMGLPNDDRIILIASNFGRSFHPAWYANLRANPDVIVTYKGHSEPYHAREVVGEERHQCWLKAMECDPGYEVYRKRAGSRRIPVILLSPARK
jgi:deazaflavin-dependent oxidoreductase (nitroreductase family)